MEFQQIFVTFAVVMIGVISIFTLMNYYNVSYGTNIAGNFSNTAGHIQNVTGSITGLATTSANNTYVTSGAGSGSTSADLINRGLSVITLLPNLLGIAPSLISDGAVIMDIPATYVNIAIAVFMFGFAILLAYMLIVGVRRII